MKLESFGYSDIGPVRNNNEDLFLELPESGFFILADGMGGHLAGEVAAKIAVEQISSHFLAAKTDQQPLEAVEELLRVSIQLANKMIYQYSRRNVDHRGMGTTICCSYFREATVTFAHVGDSRIYRYKNKEIHQLTEDHSLVSELLAIGHLEEREPVSHPYKNMITKAIGTASSIEPEISSISVETGELFLLCTDGLSDFVSQQEIAFELENCISLQKTVLNLINIAKENRTNDNVSAILVKVL